MVRLVQTLLTQRFRTLVSRQKRPPEALNCSVGALRACTPQKDHILRVSEADLKNFEVASVVTVSVCARSPSAFVMRTYEDMTLDDLRFYLT